MHAIEEIVFDDELRRLLGHISCAFGVRASIINAAGSEVAPLTERPISDYCALVQRDLGLLGACRRNDREQCSVARRSGRPHHYTCHAGLAEAVYPLVVGPQCIGFIVVGQFRTSERIPEGILARADRESAAALRIAHRTLARYEVDKLVSVLEIIAVMTRHMIEHRLVSGDKSGIAEGVERYIETHIADSPRAKEVARALGYSPKTINKKLKALTGRTFKRLIIDVKIERAKGALRESATKSVKEIAAEVGFHDPLYFSRLFRRRVGRAPTHYREHASSSRTEP